MARWALTVRRVRFLATSCSGCQHGCSLFHHDLLSSSLLLVPGRVWRTERPGSRYMTSNAVGERVGADRTSEIPLRCWRRKRTVQAIRRGFLRWRKRDSDLPFWNRKTLLSPRTYSLPCRRKHCQRLFNSRNNVPSNVSNALASHVLSCSGRTRHDTPWQPPTLPSSPAGRRFLHFHRGVVQEMPSIPFQGRSAGRRRCRRTFSFWRLVVEFVDVGAGFLKSSKFQVDFPNFFAGCAAIGLPCDRLKARARMTDDPPFRGLFLAVWLTKI